MEGSVFIPTVLLVKLGRGQLLGIGQYGRLVCTRHVLEATYSQHIFKFDNHLRRDVIISLCLYRGKTNTCSPDNGQPANYDCVPDDYWAGLPLPAAGPSLSG